MFIAIKVKTENNNTDVNVLFFGSLNEAINFFNSEKNDLIEESKYGGNLLIDDNRLNITYKFDNLFYFLKIEECTQNKEIKISI